VSSRRPTFAAAFAPLAREQDEAARLIAGALETDFGALLGTVLGEERLPGSARALRPGESPEAAAVREGEPRRRRSRRAAGGGA